MDFSGIKLFTALEFASWHHRFQRRKGFTRIPYINHPIRVAKMLVDHTNNPAEDMIIAAILHDVVEDTDATISDVIQLFGSRIASIVAEVTDDMSLPSKIRKEKQVEHASSLSSEAKQIKIADKICNINDLINFPLSWSKGKKRKYVLWSQRVVDKCKGENDALDNYFDEISFNALEILV